MHQTGIRTAGMTTMVRSKMQRSKMAASRVARAALAGAAVAMAIVMTAVSGAAAVNAAAQSTELSAIAGHEVAAMAPPGVATQEMSTPVSGTLAAPEAGPLARHELHFQGRVSGDIYTVRTGGGGAFSTMLPAGVYDLRGEHGAMIARAVMVGSSPVNLGQVHAPSRYNMWRLLERQEIGQAIVQSPAPATAYVPAPGEGRAPVAVTPVASARVMGAGPNGQPLAPAEVMPAEIQQQTELPAGAEVPAPGMPPAQDLAPTPGANGGGY